MFLGELFVHLYLLFETLGLVEFGGQVVDVVLVAFAFVLQLAL
jgi:hypothetical protein